MARGEDAVLIEVGNETCRAVLVQEVLLLVVVFSEPLHYGLGGFGADRPQLFLAAHRDGLQVLASHHGAEPGTAMIVTELIHESGVEHAILASDARLQDTDVLVA